MSPPPDPKPRGRGRPARSQAHIEDVRARIAACALKLFREEGYAAVSMRRLAQEAGCTVVTLYKYYDRKIDVLRDLWAQVFNELFDELDRQLVADRDAVLRLNVIAIGYVEYWLKRRDHYFMVFMSSGLTQSDVSVFVQNDALLQRFAIFRDTLAKALDEKVSEAELTLKSDLLLCVLNGIAHNLITISAYPWTRPEKLVRAAVQGILRT
ncbi:MAG: TetR/AcrR family transcriptional regulator [Hyphomonadaceae bacterium]|nr:MAG: transcriptional regulator [Caulobacteraceae bacterium]MBT9444135.1 TetR/AcrR family transcriptional regulator [Hyphomonadaceae bacterium]TPW07744.1 MAG: transcriptional regulator [Alphaproteobacteria bacterium]